MSKASTQTPKDAKNSKQSTLMGFFGKPKPGPPPPRPSSTNSMSSRTPSTNPVAGPSSSPITSQLRTPSTLATNMSSPLTASTRMANGAQRAVSPLKKGTAFMDGSDELSPPPEIMDAPRRSSLARGKMSSPEMGDRSGADFDMDMDGSPVIGSRRAKRKVVYAESESDVDKSDTDVATKPKLNGKGGRKLRKSLKPDSDSDEFMFDDADDAALAAAAEGYEASVVSESPSIASLSPGPTTKKFKDKKFAHPKSVPRKPTTSWTAKSPPPPAGPSSTPASRNRDRPGPKPLAQSYGEEIDARRNGSGNRSLDSSSFLLTGAEKKKIQAKDDRRNAEQCFDFLADVQDKDRRTPDHPEYDKRTIYIPPSAWNSFTPFERQFWEIKQNHYDTVLFFQKGKFYELYEDDAKIGHQEFDLKLTDRVKMKMVGVPEQSFEFWASKFLGAGYKVGKVEQSETAIGMEMRNKASKKAEAPKESKIVNRTLKQVFTNGTIVDGTYLTSDEANHCVAIKESFSAENPDQPSAFGICVLDASTGEFNLSAFEDDVCRTRLETMFRQIRPKELVHAKGNLSIQTQRLLRNILPSNTLWQSFKDGHEFYTPDKTLQQLATLFATEADAPGTKPDLPEAISEMLETPLAMEALGGMLFYLETLNLDKDLVSQKNFNVYDPIREGKNMILDGQTLGHMEVLVNNEGGIEGTLLELLQRCKTPFGKRLFRIWLTTPLREITAINDRLDAVDDLLAHPAFCSEFATLATKLPDIERLISRIHAGAIKQSDFLKVVESLEKIQKTIDSLISVAENFNSPSVAGLLRSAPDLHRHISHIDSLYTTQRDEKTIAILPTAGANPEADEADEEVARIESELEGLRAEAKKILKTKDVQFWNSAQGGKEIYQLQVPISVDVPTNWNKQSETKAYRRYYTPKTIPVIRELQEARETQATAKKNFFKHLLGEFDKDRTQWLQTVKVIAELDCLVSLSLASFNLDEPKCRPTFIDSPQAFVDFQDLRHPSMCLRSDFISNNVQLGAEQPRTILLTGPNMAGKSTLLRMTAAGVIMAQLGSYVPALKAVLSPVDKIQTRMGAYDNMFASASTFKVELDECSKILREAGPRSLVILDELGRGTSTYDGMAIAGAVLHHLATHTLPLGFFATHYGSLTDDFTYHPNIRKMHMQTQVDDALHQVVFLYKLIPGVAESSHGTHVARMAGVPAEVVTRADAVSSQFFDDFKAKLSSRRHSALPLVAHADFVWLMKVVMGTMGEVGPADMGMQVEMIRRAVGRYEIS